MHRITSYNVCYTKLLRNKYEFAEAEYKRHTELYKDDVYSEKNVQQITSEYRSLKAQLKGIEQKLLVIGVV